MIDVWFAAEVILRKSGGLIKYCTLALELISRQTTAATWLDLHAHIHTLPEGLDGFFRLRLQAAEDQWKESIACVAYE